MLLNVRGIRWCAVLASAVLLLQAQDVKEFEKKFTEFALPNGLRFVLMERHDAPAVSFRCSGGFG
jgi:hypothetical protein